jgi:hypothetical protein
VKTQKHTNDTAERTPLARPDPNGLRLCQRSHSVTGRWAAGVPRTFSLALPAFFAALSAFFFSISRVMHVWIAFRMALQVASSDLTFTWARVRTYESMCAYV